MDKLLVGLVVYFLASYNSVFSQVNLSVSVGVNYSNFDLSLFPQVSQMSQISIIILLHLDILYLILVLELSTV